MTGWRALTTARTTFSSLKARQHDQIDIEHRGAAERADDFIRCVRTLYRRFAQRDRDVRTQRAQSRHEIDRAVGPAR